MLTELTRPDLGGVKPSDLLGDLEVCDAFRKKSMLITQSTTTATATAPTTPITASPGEDAQRGRSGSRNFRGGDDIDNNIPSTGLFAQLYQEYIIENCAVVSTKCI